MKKKTIFIHASNVTGLGASQVVSSLMRALLDRNISSDAMIALPDNGMLIDLHSGKCKVKRVKRRLPNSVSRIIECLFPTLFFSHSPKTLVLGDIPLRKVNRQVVLVHQSNLIKPEINPYSSKKISFMIMRKIFELNLKYVKYLVVQSAIMKDQIIQSYPALDGRVEIIPQPAPDWFSDIKWRRTNFNNGLTLFYPAAGYPHKNHKLVGLLSKENELCCDVKEFIVTLRSGENSFCLRGPKLRNVGRLSPQECMKYYSKVDALFFPSVAESYGLPLLEAMNAGLPVICADLPYARWMCEDEAIYFDPDDVYAASRAITYTKEKLVSGWRPNWANALIKIPSGWDEVARRFMSLL